MKRILIALLAMLIYTQSFSNKNENFRGRLFHAKELLRNSQLITAYPYFMELYEEQVNNANVNY